MQITSQRTAIQVYHQCVIQIKHVSGKQTKDKGSHDFMRHQPDFTQPEIHYIFQTTLNHKNHKNQDAITGKE